MISNIAIGIDIAIGERQHRNRHRPSTNTDIVRALFITVDFDIVKLSF